MHHREYKPGMEIEVEGFISQASYSKPTFTDCDLSEHGYVAICPHTLKFTIPDGFNGIQAELASIDTALSKAADAYHSKVADLKQRKAELLQIGHTPGQQEVVEADAEQKFVDVDDLCDIPF